MSKSQVISLSTKPANNTICNIRKIGFMSKLFSRKDIGYMNLIKWNLNPEKGVSNCNTGMG